jgi:guanine deaminase
MCFEESHGRRSFVQSLIFTLTALFVGNDAHKLQPQGDKGGAMFNSYMEKAIELAEQNVENGTGGPFGAVIVREGKILATGTNQVTSAFDPTAHAEIVAIRSACNRLKNFQLSDCELYTSCEPCPMCLGAIYWARFAQVFYSGTRADAAKAGFDDAFIYEQLALAPGARSLKMTRIMNTEGEKPFQRWTQKKDKVPY